MRSTAWTSDGWPTFAERIAKGPTPENMSSTRSPGRTMSAIRLCSVARRGEKYACSRSTVSSMPCSLWTVTSGPSPATTVNDLSRSSPVTPSSTATARRRGWTSIRARPISWARGRRSSLSRSTAMSPTTSIDRVTSAARSGGRPGASRREVGFIVLSSRSTSTTWYTGGRSTNSPVPSARGRKSQPSSTLDFLVGSNAPTLTIALCAASPSWVRTFNARPRIVAPMGGRAKRFA